MPLGSLPFVTAGFAGSFGRSAALEKTAKNRYINKINMRPLLIFFTIILQQCKIKTKFAIFAEMWL
jgi:hypothetical protein